MSHSREQLMQWLADRHMWMDLLDGKYPMVDNASGNVALSGDIQEILDAYVVLHNAGANNLAAMEIEEGELVGGYPIKYLVFDFPYVVFDECKACFFLSERQSCPDCNGDGGEYRIAKH